jgi:hypothetical protein
MEHITKIGTSLIISALLTLPSFSQAGNIHSGNGYPEGYGCLNSMSEVRKPLRLIKYDSACLTSAFGTYEEKEALEKGRGSIEQVLKEIAKFDNKHTPQKKRHKITKQCPSKVKSAKLIYWEDDPPNTDDDLGPDGYDINGEPLYLTSYRVAIPIAVDGSNPSEMECTASGGQKTYIPLTPEATICVLSQPDRKGLREFWCY